MRKKISPGDTIYVFDSTGHVIETYIVDRVSNATGHKVVYSHFKDGYSFTVPIKKAHLTKEEALKEQRDYLNDRISQLRDRIDWNEDKLVEVEYELNKIRRKSP